MKPRVCGIYEIRNIVNDKVYVGSAVNIRVRWVRHRHELKVRRHHCKHLESSWHKHGADKFVFKILEELTWPVDNDLLYQREQYWIDQVPVGKLFNNVAVVDATSNNVFKFCEIQKHKFETGQVSFKLKPFERIHPVTGEIKRYSIPMEAKLDGFEPGDIMRCCQGIDRSHANFYWRFQDGSTPDIPDKHTSIFFAIVGTNIKTGDKIYINSREDYKSLGFEYSRLKECAMKVYGRKSCHGHTWEFADEEMRKFFENRATPTFEAVMRKPVVRECPKTGELKYYSMLSGTTADGFDNRRVSLCCRGKIDTYRNYRWRFA